MPILDRGNGGLQHGWWRIDVAHPLGKIDAVDSIAFDRHGANLRLQDVRGDVAQPESRGSRSGARYRWDGHELLQSIDFADVSPADFLANRYLAEKPNIPHDLSANSSYFHLSALEGRCASEKHRSGMLIWRSKLSISIIKRDSQ